MSFWYDVILSVMLKIGEIEFAKCFEILKLRKSLQVFEIH